MKRKILIIFIIIILILIPVLFNILIFNNDIYSKTTNDGWASFFGGYLGGIMTLIGVWMTIKYQINLNKKSEKNNEKRLQEQFRLENLPLLTIKEIDENINNGGIVIDLNNENFDNSYIYPVNLEIKNVGIKPAKSVELIYYDLETYDNFGITAESLLLLQNESRKISFNIYLPTKDYIINKTNTIYELMDQFHETIYLSLRYNDIIGNCYEQYFNITLSIASVVGSDSDMDFEYNAWLHYFGDYILKTGEQTYELPKEIQGISWYIKKFIELHPDYEKDIDSTIKKEIDVLLNQNHTLYKNITCIYDNIFKDKKARKGDSIPVLYKQINDSTWEVIIDNVIATNNNEHIVYLVYVLVDISKKLIINKKIEIFENTLLVDKSKKDQFKKAIKKTLYS